MSLNFHEIEITVYRGVRDTTGYRSTLFEFLNDVEYDAIKPYYEEIPYGQGREGFRPPFEWKVTKD